MSLTDSEILANRRKVIDYLKQPGLRKAKGELRNSVGGRCCLGHMCDAFGLEGVKSPAGIWTYKDERYGLPAELIEALGMHDEAGRFRDAKSEYGYIAYFGYENNQFDSLANLNDDSTITPGKIGEFLETMIDGDSRNSPWKRINVGPTP